MLNWFSIYPTAEEALGSLYFLLLNEQYVPI
jgi:hypothetical protein